MQRFDALDLATVYTCPRAPINDELMAAPTSRKRLGPPPSGVGLNHPGLTPDLLTLSVGEVPRDAVPRQAPEQSFKERPQPRPDVLHHYILPTRPSPLGKRLRSLLGQRRR